MTSFPLIIPANEGSPALHIHVNLPYNLYHYLGKQARMEPAKCQPEVADAAFLLGQAHNPLGVHGTWSDGEGGFADTQTVQEAAASLRVAVARSAEQVEQALTQAEAFFRETIWPQRAALFAEAFVTLQRDFVPHFAQNERQVTISPQLLSLPFV